MWHGINAVALIRRARKDGVELDGFGDPDAIAADILKQVTERDLDKKADMWDFATAGEACVALGLKDDAIQWTQRYLRDTCADAFEVTISGSSSMGWSSHSSQRHSNPFFTFGAPAGAAIRTNPSSEG